MATIRKNTKAHAEAISSAKNIARYALDNSFKAQPVESILPRHIEMGTLKRHGDKYTLDVHSNLWFEFAA